MIYIKLRFAFSTITDLGRRSTPEVKHTVYKKVQCQILVFTLWMNVSVTTRHTSLY